jgi:hypothetical protein
MDDGTDELEVLSSLQVLHFCRGSTQHARQVHTGLFTLKLMASYMIGRAG